MADAWQNIVQDVRVELNALAAAAAPGASVAAVILGLNHTVQLGTPKYTVQGDKVRIRVPLLGRTQWLQSTSPTPAGLLWDPNIPATLQFTLPVTPTLAAAVQKVMTDIQAWIQAFHAEVDQRLKYWTRELELLLQAKVPPPAVNVPQIMTTLGFTVDAAP